MVQPASGQHMDLPSGLAHSPPLKHQGSVGICLPSSRTRAAKDSGAVTSKSGMAVARKYVELTTSTFSSRTTAPHRSPYMTSPPNPLPNQSHTPAHVAPT